MPGGGVAGVVVALTPAPNPTHGIVVVAPGAAADAASIAADLLGARGRSPASPAPTPTPPGAADAAPLVTPPAPATIRLGRTLASGRTRVESLAVDDYIAQVAAGEGQPRAGEAAQQALAITARTFALANRGRHGREGFDLCDTTHCQVVRPATTDSRRAAAATSGRVLLASGQPASVFYSAWCGGRLERASQVWPGAIDHRHPQRDDACSGEPPWTSDVRAGDVERALRAPDCAAAGCGPARRAAQRLGPRRAAARRGPHAAARLRHDFRMAMGRIVGWQTVKSTAFEVQRTGSGYRFRGTGFGHGVGLCVIGAGVRAGRGETAAAILGFYFPDLAVGHVSAPAAATAGSASASTSRLTAPPAAAPAAEPATAATAAAAASTGDVQLGLPLAEESERSVILALVRRARDDIARAAGVRAPASLRLTVHPTVESFGRATGQPWWSAGATSGTTIHLLPTAVAPARRARSDGSPRGGARVARRRAVVATAVGERGRGHRLRQ